LRYAKSTAFAWGEKLVKIRVAATFLGGDRSPLQVRDHRCHAVLVGMQRFQFIAIGGHRSIQKLPYGKVQLSEF